MQKKLFLDQASNSFIHACAAECKSFVFKRRAGENRIVKIHAKKGIKAIK